MGGHAGGAIASGIAVSAIISALSDKWYDDPREAIGVAINAAHIAIQARAIPAAELHGMGTTCVVLLVRDSKVYMGHVGDSRIYLCRSHRLIQLTTDHSFAQLLVDAGQLTPEQAERHPRKNEITNALGIPTMQPPTVRQEPVIPEAGDCFLLCSDGLSGMVPHKKLAKIISDQQNRTSQERVEALVKEANKNGGPDNITALLVEFSFPPSVTIGRSGCDIIVPKGFVSRSHLEIEYIEADDMLRVVDTSTSGSIINGKYIHHESITIPYKPTEILLAGRNDCRIDWTTLSNKIRERQRSQQPKTRVESKLAIGYKIFAFISPLVGWIHSDK
jgi:serine/threonine protein phosphatase PrpC